MTDGTRYETIGEGYALLRHADPAIAGLIATALGDARTVVNVGAGAGSYEPRDRGVIAIEPSDVMAAQRPRELVPAIRATAGRLPLRDRSVDAAMAVMTIHHWDDEQEAGVRELARVARDTVVILTFDAAVAATMWLVADYAPEVGELDRATMPPPETVAAWLGGDAEVTTVPTTRDTPDWMFGAFWAHPERVLDPRARAATSGFARLGPAVTERIVRAVAADLESGAWDQRHGHLRGLDALDVGVRLIVARLG